MGSFSLSHWIVVALVVLVLFGRGKISETMGDFGKGIRSFRKGLSESEETDCPPNIEDIRDFSRPTGRGGQQGTGPSSD